MISCKLCGHEFDETKAEELDCNCGCGGHEGGMPAGMEGMY